MSRAAERRAARRQRRKDRRDAKQTRRDSRRQARLDRRQVRQDARTARQANRQATKQTAYEAGINPNAWIGDTIGSVADSAGSMLTSKFQAENQPTAMTPRNEDATGGNNNMLLIIGAALVGFMLMKK